MTINDYLWLLLTPTFLSFLLPVSKDSVILSSFNILDIAAEWQLLEISASALALESRVT